MISPVHQTYMRNLGCIVGYRLYTCWLLVLFLLQVCALLIIVCQMMSGTRQWFVWFSLGRPVTCEVLAVPECQEELSKKELSVEESRRIALTLMQWPGHDLVSRLASCDIKSRTGSHKHQWEQCRPPGMSSKWICSFADSWRYIVLDSH